MKTPTITELASRHGTSRATVTRARDAGIDIKNGKALARYLSTRGKRVSSHAIIADIDPAAKAQTIEEIRAALTESNDYETVRILAEKLRGLLALERLRADLLSMIRAEDAEQCKRRLYCATGAAIKHLVDHVAPLAAGRSAAVIHKVMMTEGHQLLEKLADLKSDFWKQADRKFPIADVRLK